MFMQLTEQQLQKKMDFINHYISSKNAADGSKLDANANVTHKNIATLEAEINKDINIQINRRLVAQKIGDLFGQDLADEYIRQIEAHEIYVHDETSLKPYCASISMYPLLLNGLVSLGGESKAPRHLESFCGSFINMVFAINQPAAARGYQSVFWNISLYDRYYFKSLFQDFVFPDGERPQWDSIEELQEFFMNWFNEERKKSILTFPVVTAAMLVDGGLRASL